ncbi:MAG: hypothetical protein M1829_002215 [Trizodia sp. TS-e1964]|nr:MAG: hypothetical protein M1829_002215 [Trizodia sp. TS-e1964]
MLSFDSCMHQFEDNSTNLLQYSYHGPVSSITEEDGSPSLITLQGCQALCGTGVNFYHWSSSSSTITTWVLPILGLLLQAPFESNQALNTLFAISRWLGSPIASLSYILWNIKATGKCARIVDMSTRYSIFPDENSDFAQIRDSFFIMSYMNQYVVKSDISVVEAEKLLRIALFSNDLELLGTHKTLPQMRRKLARILRGARRRGTVPVFVSLVWFLFSLAISIQFGKVILPPPFFPDPTLLTFFSCTLAFTQLGNNSQAHDLALGLLLSWTPVLILSGIVDRNPIAATDVRQRLNKLLDLTRQALASPALNNSPQHPLSRRTTGLSDHFLSSPLTNSHSSSTITTTTTAKRSPASPSDFFVCFAGQGRLHWHYGVAHPILSGIERSLSASTTRGWLQTIGARLTLTHGPANITGLFAFDLRDAWQILSAVIIVLGTSAGAFIVSYNTPTVGLGCRSGGYLIFCVIAMGLFLLEMSAWRLSSRTSPTRRWIRRAVRLLEVGNTAWLAYIVSAQTFGLYESCACKASNWAGHGGYINFRSIEVSRSPTLGLCWGVGTGLSTAIMAAGFAYIICEWCAQSHLSTEDYGKAMRGLRRTRWWGRWCGAGALLASWGGRWKQKRGNMDKGWERSGGWRDADEESVGGESGGAVKQAVDVGVVAL